MNENTCLSYLIVETPTPLSLIIILILILKLVLLLFFFFWNFQITSNATSDLNIKVDGRAIVRGNEGVFIMGKTIEFHMGGNMELKAVSIFLRVKENY